MRGATRLTWCICASVQQFQSTHPVRGATKLHRLSGCCVCYFNPRTPCGVRRASPLPCKVGNGIPTPAPLAGAAFREPAKILEVRSISIHAPRAGCDAPAVLRIESRQLISIHAPRAGCDFLRTQTGCLTTDFNPRTPCGVRPTTSSAAYGSTVNFNPRTPCGVRQP